MVFDWHFIVDNITASVVTDRYRPQDFILLFSDNE